ncbi:MAG: hypothetical protein LBQ16_00085 [Gracilibacteraceae bacterium]|nr:hypothetical protein [Gracilibacteraceae bacterium]
MIKKLINYRLPNWAAAASLVAAAVIAALLVLNRGNYYEEVYYGDEHYLDSEIIFYHHWQIRDGLDSDNSEIEISGDVSKSAGISWSGEKCNFSILSEDDLPPEAEISMEFRFADGGSMHVNKKIADYTELEPCTAYTVSPTPPQISLGRIHISPYSIVIDMRAAGDPREMQWELEMSDGSKMPLDKGSSQSFSEKEQGVYALASAFYEKINPDECRALIIDGDRFILAAAES